jgi:hypothetical protein
MVVRLLRNSSLMKRFLWLIVIALWVALLASSLFIRIESDDYCFASVIETEGITGSLSHWYQQWAGRYSQQLTHAVFASLEPYGARIGVPILMGAFVLAWWYALSYWYKRWDALLLALAFGAALVMSRPNDEPIYWLSGVTSYWTPFMGIGVLLGALLRRRTVLAVLTALLAVAFTEAGGMLMLAGIGLSFLFWRGERRRIALVFTAAALGFLVMFVAPGNAVRMAALEPAELNLPHLVHVVLGGFATNAVLSALWTVVPGLFLSGVGAEMGSPFAARRLPLAFLGLALAGAALIAVIAAFTISWGVDARVMYLLAPLWLAQWFFIGVLIGQRTRLWRWMTLVGALLLIPAGQHVAARIAYAQKWDARHALILAGEPVSKDIGPWDTYTAYEWVVDCAEAWYGGEIRFVDSLTLP